MDRFRAFLRRNGFGLLAVFIALGGTAYAAGKIGSSDIASNAVKSKHIAANKVKGSDVKEASLKIPAVVEEDRSADSTGTGEGLYAEARCPAGYSVTGGGFRLGGITARPIVTGSERLGPGAVGWVATAESTAAGQFVDAQALCMRGLDHP